MVGALPAERQPTDEQAHGDVDAAQHAHAGELSCRRACRQRGAGRADQQPCGAEHADRLARHEPEPEPEPERNTQRNGLHEGIERDACQAHADIREGKRRQHQKHHPRMQRMLCVLERRAAAPVSHRNRHRSHHTGQRRVDARLQHASAYQQSDGGVRADGHDPGAVQQCEQRNADTRRRQHGP